MDDTLRYLGATEVAASMPPVAERLRLAEVAMTALVADAELPPKIGVHPRPVGSFAHAMPAALRPVGADPDGSNASDLLGLKWVTGFPSNRDRELPAIHALVLLSDPATGRPVAVLDGAAITAHRTAAVSGVAITRFAPAGAARAAIVGAGVQGESHLEVLGHLLPGVTLAIHDRHPDRARQLAEQATSTDGIASAVAVDDLRAAIAGADVVVTAASFAPPAERQRVAEHAFAPGALIVAVDYATIVAASVARDASLFLVDELGQFRANRDAGQFDGYPDPDGMLGEAILEATPRPSEGRVLVSHLGVGLADLVFADAIVERAVAAGLGTVLVR